MLGEQARLQAVLGALSGNAQLSEDDFRYIRNALTQIHETLTVNLDDAKSVSTPALTNVPAGSSLHALIVDRGDTGMPRLEGDAITGEWLGKLLTRLDGVLSRLKRVHFKSLGSLLAFQEKLAADGRALAAEQKDDALAAVPKA